MVVEAKRFVKATVPSSLIENPSPASIQPTRLALLIYGVNYHTDDTDSVVSVYFASGSRVYNLQISMDETLVNRGKDSLLIPSHTEVIRSSVFERCLHHYEIQSIGLTKIQSTGQFVLGSVDSYGHLIVSELYADGKDAQRLSFAVVPQDGGVGEGSWAGLSFSPVQWSMVAVARSFPKCIDIYDQDICLRTLRTLWYPSSLTYVQSQFYGSESSILAVTEGCQLSMWDLRMKENGGCLQRISGSPGDILYAASTSPTGNIAVGGADRTLTIYDPRRWTVVSRWMHCSKYEITSLAFSSVDPDFIYIQGVDYEVFCGQWSKSTKIFSFRGDSSWLGCTMSPNIDRDILGGWSDSGGIFVADIGT